MSGMDSFVHFCVVCVHLYIKDSITDRMINIEGKTVEDPKQFPVKPLKLHSYTKISNFLLEQVVYSPGGCVKISLMFQPSWVFIFIRSVV